MVTERFLGCTLSSTHMLWSVANLWGSSARKHRSSREQLQSEREEGEKRERWGVKNERERERERERKREKEREREERMGTVHVRL